MLDRQLINHTHTHTHTGSQTDTDRQAGRHIQAPVEVEEV